jgi:hypothetical protein
MAQERSESLGRRCESSQKNEWRRLATRAKKEWQGQKHPEEERDKGWVLKCTVGRQGKKIKRIGFPFR